MNWIGSKAYDLSFIIGPAFLSSFIVISFYFLGYAPKEVSPVQWLILVVFIDVAHVWSTLFRTYFNKTRSIRYSNHLWVIPLCCYLVGVVLHSVGKMVFWKTLAYLAVFHFVRQQYGFFKLYNAKEKNNDLKFDLLNKLMIYSATIIPVLIWHVSGTSEISWFMKGDFFIFVIPVLTSIFTVSAILIALAYFYKELVVQKNSIISPKNLVVIGTALSWWVGIVWIKTDWAFTFTNVVSHGVPYLGLIYLTDMNQRDELYWPRRLPTIFFFLFLFFIAYFEEGLWDIFIWKEHQSLFPFSLDFGEELSVPLMALVVPLLALPQATHYILDGFIWRNRPNEY